MEMKAGPSTGAYHMSRRDFTREIDVLRQRVATFARHERQSAAPQPVVGEAVEALSAALEELQAAHEELQRANEMLQQQNAELTVAHQRYQELFDFAPEAYLVTDTRGVIREANDTAAALLKIRRDFLIGKPLKVFIAEEDSQTFLIRLSQLCQGEGAQEWELRVQPREGPGFPALISITPEHDVQRRVIGIRWLLRNFSERKRAEEMLQRAHDDLEQRVRERTAELSSANAALKVALQQKDMLLKEIHHRVKNNLQIVSSLLSLQAGYNPDPLVKEMLADSQQRIQSMALIHEILYQSRDLGRINMAIYLQTLTSHLVRSYRTDDTQITLTLSVDQVLLDVDTAIPCGLLLNELISNCLKHAFPDHRKGDVAVDLHADPSGLVTLTIRDDGIGFPADLDFRNSNTLGLQLVTGLVEQLQGTITMTRDVGCAFTITFSP
jgi:PAS domain S-box-containing protein